ncbi:hypothetical protein Tco_0011098 [Tanacetum coccineum]
MLVVEGDRGTSRLKIISCIKASKYIERGHQLFVAHVTEKEPKEKCLEDVPVIRDFPEVFPDDLPGLPPPRQVEFKIELVPGVLHVLRARPRTDWHIQLKELATNRRVIMKKYIGVTEEERGVQTLKQKLSSHPYPSLRLRELENFIVYAIVHRTKVKEPVLDQRISVSKAISTTKEHEKKLSTTHGFRLGTVGDDIELLSDYNCEIRYHPGKANIVADALSRKDREPIRVRSLVMTVHTNLPERIVNAQTDAMKEENVKAKNLGRLIKPIFETRSDGIQCFEGRIWLPLFGGLRDLIMHESHKSKYSIHPGSDKMYQDIKKALYGAEHRKLIIVHLCQ